MEQKPSIGRVVHYTFPTEYGPERSRGQIRPATIVRVWDENTGCSQLQVLVDNTNDGFETGLHWATSVLFDADGKPGTWRWPPRV